MPQAIITRSRSLSCGDGSQDDIRIDRRELAPGDALDPEIRTAIDESAHVIVVLSPEALKSAWVKKEVDYARELRSSREGFRLVPVLRPPFEPSMTSWILGEDVVAIPLGEDPGAFDQAVAEILVALGFELREDSEGEGPRAELRSCSRSHYSHLLRSQYFPGVGGK